MKEQINVGDRVVYVPYQNKGDNIHHDAVVVALTNRHNFYLIDAVVVALTNRHNFYLIDVVGGKKTRVHRKRLLVGQVDAFQASECAQA